MISVVIPCYNYGHLIIQTIESVLMQSFHDLEVIVIDDGSTDNTADAMQAIIDRDARVRYFRFENTGLAASRNRGLERATGEFIQFLDADDLLEKEKFAIQVKLFEQYPGTDVVYGSVRYFEEDPSVRTLTYWGVDKEWMPKLSGRGHEILARTLMGNFSHLSSPLFRRSIVDKVGLFDNSVSAVADYQFLLRCAIADAVFYYHDDPGSYSLVRWHANNMSKKPDFMWKEEIRMRQELSKALVPYPEAFQRNEDAIKSYSYKLNKSWKNAFLSGGKFDSFKILIKKLGLDKLAKKIFYR